MLPVESLINILPPPDTVQRSIKTQIVNKERVVTEYLDLPLCFDLESYSFREIIAGDAPEKPDYKKCAIMWAYGIAVGDTVLIGRTWESFVIAIRTISDYYELNDNRRVIIWVHNLGYDFQFFRKWLSWKAVFALDPRKVCYALTDIGVEFRCSYILTGYSLEKVAENLQQHTVKKLVGEIDYTLPRHSNTVLTDKEIAYLENDCLVVTAHIQEQIDIEGGLSHIPLTKTGYVRRYVRKACFRDTTKKLHEDYTRKAYKDYIQTLYLDNFQYKSCKRAFQGGFTHANPCYVGATMEKVSSLDIISCYPAQIIANLYPVTPPQYVNHFESEEEFNKTIKNNCCIFTITLYNVESVINYDHYLSSSHCDIPQGKTVQLSNGRIVKAEELTSTITNIDFFIIKRVYRWSKYKVTGFIKWGWGYLPKPIIESTLYMYEQKTTLKGVEGKEVEYLSLKEMLNSIYGMMVTDPLRPEIPYNLVSSEWGKMENGILHYKVQLTPEEQTKALNKYNDDINRFTYYPWGVFITAYARHMLWSAILEFKSDYIYSDTDSIKCINYNAHKEFIQKYNSYMEDKIKNCLKYYGIDITRAKPETIKHEKKSLGTWELEDPLPGTDYTYNKFKTLGAKRYMVDARKGLSITVSGVNKKIAVPYIQDECARLNNKCETDTEITPFDYFTQGMEIPPGYAGKLIPFYGDEEIKGIVTDHTGEEYEYYEKSYVNMENGGYTLSISKDFVAYLTLLMRGFLF